MSNLKELTKEAHTNAERQDFVKVLMSGKMHPDFYATYLWNQHKKYDILEALAGALGVFNNIPMNIRRKQAIEADFLELWKHEHQPTIVPSTTEYIERFKTIMGDVNALTAHVYVLHMGDLSGGQMIKKRIPGSGKMYEFEGDVLETKEAIRAQTNDDMAEEAKWMFESATQLFKEMMELDIEHYLEETD